MENTEFVPLYFGYEESENRGVISRQVLPEVLPRICICQRKCLFVSTCICLSNFASVEEFECV